MRTKKLNNKGFTLVEVIVVAVIVAVLALVGIQLYQGYVRDARLNTAENLAASAAGFLATERNRGTTLSDADGSWAGGAQVTASGTGVTQTSFTVPANCQVDFTGDMSSGGTVSATVAVGSSNSVASTGAYRW